MPLNTMTPEGGPESALWLSQVCLTDSVFRMLFGFYFYQEATLMAFDNHHKLSFHFNSKKVGL